VRPSSCPATESIAEHGGWASNPSQGWKKPACRLRVGHLSANYLGYPICERMSIDARRHFSGETAPDRTFEPACSQWIACQPGNPAARWAAKMRILRKLCPCTDAEFGPYLFLPTRKTKLINTLVFLPVLGLLAAAASIVDSLCVMPDDQTVLAWMRFDRGPEKTRRRQWIDGLRMQPWRADVRFGPVRQDDRLYISLAADKPWTGKPGRAAR